MRDFFRFMASTSGRWTRGIIGLALMAWGYSFDGPQANILLIFLGCFPFFTAIFDICLLAPIFGYPVRGEEIIRRYGEIGNPGEV